MYQLMKGQWGPVVGHAIATAWAAATASGRIIRTPGWCLGALSQVDQFLGKSGKFSVPGYPQKLGFLLYGPPGTGAIASITQQQRSGEAGIRHPLH